MPCAAVQSETFLIVVQRSVAESDEEHSKKPRRSERHAAQKDQTDQKQTHLPSPVTVKEATNDSVGDDETKHDLQRPTKSPSPAAQKYGQRTPHSSPPPASQGLRSPPSDTQAYSQFITPAPYSYEVKDEEGEGVWGYLVPLTGGPDSQKTMVLRRRTACPKPTQRPPSQNGRQVVKKDEYKEQEQKYEETKIGPGMPAGGYLIGRHPECGK